MADDIDYLLVKKTQKGDKRAFDLLVLKYQHRLAGSVSRWVSEPDLVQDIVQESFLKAFKAVDHFRGDSAFFTWLYSIATNTAKSHLQSAGRKPSYRAVDIDEFSDMPIAGLIENQGPMDRLVNDQLQAQFHLAMKQLPDDLRIALSLRELEGMSYQDIADIVQAPIGTVRSRIFRAREYIELTLRPWTERSPQAYPGTGGAYE